MVFLRGWAAHRFTEPHYVCPSKTMIIAVRLSETRIRA